MLLGGESWTEMAHRWMGGEEWRVARLLRYMQASLAVAGAAEGEGMPTGIGMGMGMEG